MNQIQMKVDLERAGVTFRPSLTAREFRVAETRFGFEFPPDLRDFLAFAMPAGGKFPDWRNLDGRVSSECLA